MRREELYLRDIVEAADFVAQFVDGLDRPAFQQSELIRSAVAHKLSIVGEAAARMPEEVRSRHPEIPWPKIVAFRNIMVHAYFGIDWDEVWRAATRECPALRAQVESVLDEEFGTDAWTDCGNRKGQVRAQGQAKRTLEGLRF